MLGNNKRGVSDASFPRQRQDAEARAEEEEDQRVQASAGLLEEALLGPLHDAGRAVQRLGHQMVP